MYYRLIKIASLLPEFALRKLARRFDTPGAFELPELGSCFWMDAGYHRYSRIDRRCHPEFDYRCENCGRDAGLVCQMDCPGRATSF